MEQSFLNNQVSAWF